MATIERPLGRAVFGLGGPPDATVLGHAGRLTSGQYSAHIALIGPDGSTLSERSITTKHLKHELHTDIDRRPTVASGAEHPEQTGALLR